ncbi:aminotransferase class I/II-fold pyridoxal phosphate-dependent enzyme [Opitutus sp. ER46]|uniref:aminotransferase class I/II-fold pyridoxal phosphate-dependent enzyme n=1 Tax=Opitutus sp. ER46 TaxID=2161864 RepID=UPI000D313BE4|nr:aminotransferase class I/II-fold pyridoxal phosphate-dependent enzyme [Opitutus sp. ER46]PTX92387.1 threonine-phosphate decarboxylase [Opitutus sp. ER46]
MLHGHGDDAYRYGVPVRANFSSNVPPDAELAGLRKHLETVFERVRAYPEVAAESLAGQLAGQHGVAPAQVVVTAGATAAIYLIAQAYRGADSAVIGPTFSEYADAARMHGHDVRQVGHAELQTGNFGAAELVWVCNPNNPTGEVLAREALLEIVVRSPGVTFVLDLAYAADCEESPVEASDLAAHPNLILVHSLTKRFGVPGLRLGYIVAADPVARRLAALLPPWSVGVLAQEAGAYLLRQRGPDAADRDARLVEARRLARALAAIPHVRVRPSATSFFLLELGRGRAAELKSYLLRHHGLLVRDASNFPGLDERHVRVCAQTLEQNRWLEEGVAAWMRS